jgi:hypothetical protein
MGVHNHQRRAAKAQRRARRKDRRGPSGHGRPPGGARRGTSADGAYSDGPSSDGFTTDPLAVADLAITSIVRGLMRRTRSAEGVHEAARVLRFRVAPMPDVVLVSAVRDLLDRLLLPVLEHWAPQDLAELVRRDCGERSLSALAGLLRRAGGTAGGGLAADSEWRAEVDALGPPRGLDLSTDDGLAQALHLAALLALAPAGEPGRAAPRRPAGPAPTPDDAKRLATVRALLAKAESTPYDEEAEALTAKAQELVTRYALDRLLAAGPEPAGSDPRGCVVVRRLWLDSPYPDAKSSLVQEVAEANRCRAVYARSLTMCTLIGDPADVAAVELLVTSLLLQASRAMLRHGSQVDRAGMSRTRSFRRSFLTAFAARIGQRLRAATQHEVDTADRRADLLPALRTHSERVEEVLEEMFPHLTRLESTVSNAAGWAAGQVAADLASFDVHAGLESDPSRPTSTGAGTLW